MRRAPFFLMFVLAILVALFAYGRLRAAGIPTVRENHMEMTVHAAPAPGDSERGDAILAAARAVVAKYANVADAERDGYKKFLPNIPLPFEHYTNRTNAMRAIFGSFDASAPTSIIYKREPSGLRVVGVMYTAANGADAAALDARVPLSLGTWHRHVDFCRAPAGVTDDARFGFAGTIDSQAACEAAGGRFIPRVFGWMVHVWPMETAPAKIWAVDADSEMGHHLDASAVADQAALPIAREKIPSLTLAAGDATRGSEIFAGNCASCHGAGGANGPDAPRLRASGLTAGQVAYMVEHPRAIDSNSRMPEFGFSQKDIADVAAYVGSLSVSQAP